MRRERACLDQLPATTSKLLGLRAGLGGPPASRAEAASRLGISRSTAARLEHRGLRALHSACGGSSTGGGASSSTGTAPARLLSLAMGAPALQPAAYLHASSGAATLRPAADLGHPRGSQEVKGVTSSSPPPSAAGPVAAAATSSAIGQDGAGNPSLPIILAACLAALAALMLVGLRRRAVVSRRGAMVASAVAAPAPAREIPAARATPTAATPIPPAAALITEGHEPASPAPAAAAEAPRATSGWVGPSADRPTGKALPTAKAPPAASTRARIARSASVVASGLASLAVRELVRRRRRH
ncbi:MAG: hypothetical protein QOE38_2463 [Thermoleophilaceae bacterium]|nr:hypothetical protein [Thermoleophilaceae bacterium]